MNACMAKIIYVCICIFAYETMVGRDVQVHNSNVMLSSNIDSLIIAIYMICTNIEGIAFTQKT